MRTILFKLSLFTFGFAFLAAGDHPQMPSKPALSDPKAVLENLQTFYATHPYIYHELTYTLYADHQTATPHSVDHGIFIQSGDTRYARLAAIESLTTKDYTVAIDHDDRLVLLANRISLPPTAAPIDPLEVWTANPDEVEVRYASEQHDVLLVSTEYGEVQQAEIWYDKQTFQPAKIILKYRRSIVLETDAEGDPVQPRIEIEYRNTSFDGQGRERLDLNGYVRRKGEDWAPVPAYRDYEFINNIRELAVQN
ncbi:MAG: hypothetical protein KIS77_09865 [Saprospiraceae bacterium]|nr:hypothetical protein [Saprospiraceae bacterium]